MHIFAPVIQSRTPAVNAVDIEPDPAAVSITFNEEMNQTTLTTSSIYVRAGSASVYANLTKTGTTATPTFASKLRFYQQYTVYVTDGCRDLAGNPLPAT